ncbi:MAG: OadG family protein [Desulfobacterales bacterium]|nr:OadG family protein [Desulfobacterales bacterium]
MFGLKAISHYNGWTMAAIGISIVFTGLFLLSIAVSQLHKVLKLWDNRKKNYQRIKAFWKRNAQKGTIIESDIKFARTLHEASKQYKILIERLGEPFAIPKLVEFSENCGLGHPPDTIEKLLKAEIIIPDGKGYYIWNQSDENTAKRHSWKI